MTTELKATVEIRHLRGLRAQLADIERSLRIRKAGGLGPRSGRAALAAAAIFGIAYAAMYFAVKAGAKLPTGSLGLGFGLAVFGMWLVNRYSAAPRTYTEKIQAMLRLYDPVAVEAYLDLLKSEQRGGTLDSVTLYEWILRERNAVNEALQRCSAHSLASAVIDRARGK